MEWPGPTFRDDPKVMAVGRGIVRRMLHWYAALPPDLKAAVGGFTLLNEPAHLMPKKKDVMLGWMGDVIGDYRALVAGPNAAAGEKVPKLYVNLIETSGLHVRDMAAFMQRTFSAAELGDWAAMDLHMYLAWAHNGGASRRATCSPHPHCSALVYM